MRLVKIHGVIERTDTDSCLGVKISNKNRLKEVRSRTCQSQWPRALKHEPSSPARALGSWIRIPLEAWMSVCVYSVCAVLCVGKGVATG
jgi:hypothetical protein